MKPAIAALTVWCAGSVQAHEFWIDPAAFSVRPGTALVADIRVGEMLEGPAYSYIPPNFTRFDIVLGDTVIPVEGRAGDRPALNQPVAGDGLAVVVHATRNYRLTYRDWNKFVAFVTHKDFAWALEQHAARGLPQTGFAETYSRHAKSLIAIGDGAGQDRVVGLETEIVALANPYTDGMTDGLPVRVLYQGQPRAGSQVELFENAPDGTVEARLYRTDANGIARLDVKPGFSYLADHVVLRAVEPEADGAPVWESLWASLTFAVPE